MMSFIIISCNMTNQLPLRLLVFVSIVLFLPLYILCTFAVLFYCIVNMLQSGVYCSTNTYINAVYTPLIPEIELDLQGCL